ncbi:hypothetical protein [Agrobacterium tumefaciens]|jgi:hypothetical protein|uniref:terminase small subunit-like protein n=1 Tax=Agrobacterium tumefaciens TaxID=358 RepID=UPI000DD74A05|nr:hypothetical protein [Agrobacterium tumefaciens]
MSYCEEIADTICYHIVEGESLRSMCDNEYMPGANRIQACVAGVTGSLFARPGNRILSVRVVAAVETSSTCGKRT